MISQDGIEKKTVGFPIFMEIVCCGTALSDNLRNENKRYQENRMCQSRPIV